jgi:hypothetical protein
MALTIDELLDSLENPNTNSKTLPNTTDTWSRIGNRDNFSELNMNSSELDEFLREWVANNPYETIS